MLYFVTVENRVYEVEVDNGQVVSVDGQSVHATLRAPDDSPIRALHFGHAVHPVAVEPQGSGRWMVGVAGARLEVEAIDERTRTIRELSGGSGGGSREVHVRAPMPGLVVKIEVSAGQVVTSGQGIAIVEAMKMENELTAASDARVASIEVAPGDTVEKGQVLVQLEPLGGPDDDHEP